MNGQWLQLQDLVHPAIHLPMKIRMTNIHKVLFPLSRWRRDALQRPEIQGSLDGNTCVHIRDGRFACVTWDIKGLIVLAISSQIPKDRNCRI